MHRGLESGVRMYARCVGNTVRMHDYYYVHRNCGTPGDPPLFELKLMYSYVIELADSESDLGFFNSALVSEIMVFLRIRVTCIF